MTTATPSGGGNADPELEPLVPKLASDAVTACDPRAVLDLDWWALNPGRSPAT